MGVHEQAEKYHNTMITQKELTDAFRRTFGFSLIVAGETAARYFADIVKHREPLWHTGDVVRDANGNIWECQVGQESWAKPGSSMRYEFDAPKRPLKKLVEEE